MITKQEIRGNCITADLFIAVRKATTLVYDIRTSASARNVDPLNGNPYEIRLRLMRKHIVHISVFKQQFQLNFGGNNVYFSQNHNKFSVQKNIT